MKRFLEYLHIHQIGKWLRRNCKALVVVLLLTLCVVFISLLFLKGYKARDAFVFFNSHLNEISQISSIVRNIAYVIAIFVGGWWWYYTFVRGRLFRPRLTINISIKSLIGENNEIAIVNFCLRNIGKSRFMINAGSADFYYGTLKDHKVVFTHFKKIDNLLSRYNEAGLPMWIEPEGEANVDICLSTSIIQKHVGKVCQSSLLLRIAAVVCPGKCSRHLENTILTYPVHREEV